MGITPVHITQTRRDITEYHFHFNLLRSDYWRCVAEQGENGLQCKVLHKRPANKSKKAQCKTDIHQMKELLLVPELIQ